MFIAIICEESICDIEEVSVTLNTLSRGSRLDLALDHEGAGDVVDVEVDLTANARDISRRLGVSIFDSSFAPVSGSVS